MYLINEMIVIFHHRIHYKTSLNGKKAFSSFLCASFVVISSDHSWLDSPRYIFVFNSMAGRYPISTIKLSSGLLLPYHSKS